MKIIQVNGIRGLVTIVFAGICLFAGFVVFPGLVIMHYWNLYLVNLYSFPVLNAFQGCLLWAMIATIYCIITKNDFALSFKNSSEFSSSELNDIIKSANFGKSIKLTQKTISKEDFKKLEEKGLIKNPFQPKAKTSKENTVEESKAANSNNSKSL